MYMGKPCDERRTAVGGEKKNDILLRTEELLITWMGQEPLKAH
jgi:hypothetical protein